MFSTLETLLAGFGGCRVLDLYAGSGALGLEALSRGAAEVLLVERDATAAGVIRNNVEAVGLPGASVVAAPAERVVAEPAATAYDLVLADPPYADEVAGVLAAVVVNGWLAPDGILAVERSSRDAALEWPAGVAPVRDKRYGEAWLWYGRRAVEGEGL